MLFSANGTLEHRNRILLTKLHGIHFPKHLERSTTALGCMVLLVLRVENRNPNSSHQQSRPSTLSALHSHRFRVIWCRMKMMIWYMIRISSSSHAWSSPRLTYKPNKSKCFGEYTNMVSLKSSLVYIVSIEDIIWA